MGREPLTLVVQGRGLGSGCRARLWVRGARHWEQESGAGGAPSIPWAEGQRPGHCGLGAAVQILDPEEVPPSCQSQEMWGLQTSLEGWGTERGQSRGWRERPWLNLMSELGAC